MTRIRVAQRHALPEQSEHEVFTTGALKVDLTHRIVMVAGEPINLPPTEYALLWLMIQHFDYVHLYAMN